MLFVLFVVTSVCRISAGWFCDCDGHSHGVTSICNIQHSHNSDDHCHEAPTLGHCCGLHFDTLEYEAQSLTQCNKKCISKNIANLFCGNYHLSNLNSWLITLKREFFNLRHRILSQWHISSLRQRPPPVLV